MTSRHRLWLVLCIFTLPLVLQGTTGCDIVFPLRDGPPADNALQCDCNCSGAGSAQVRVIAGTDDAEQSGANVDLNSTDLDLGTTIVGVRFPAAGIPKGATIQSAYVQFTADESDGSTASIAISAEASISAVTFTTADNDVSGRVGGTATPVTWNADPWSAGDFGPAQQTPSLVALLQELVDLPGWKPSSAVVLRFEAGTGHRTAESAEGDPQQTKAALLVVTFDGTVKATLPVCASDEAEFESGGRISSASLATECGKVEATIEKLGEACGYPTGCTCAPVDIPDQDDSFKADVCDGDCSEAPIDATCSNFDPNAFADCLAGGGTVEDCKHFVAATNANVGDPPICVASGSPLAFHLFGRRSRCELSGTSEIHVGDREPKQDPVTTGVVELLGGPCPGSGGCSVYPYFDLRMAPITFAIRFHSDPTFGDLSAIGRGLQSVTLDGTGKATFPADSVTGTGGGRRGTSSRSFNSENATPLVLEVGWVARTCSLDGNLAGAVDGETPDGLCDGDGATPCTADSPDCDDAGGPCVFFETEDVENMTVDVNLTVGSLVNQPPAAAAGLPQTVECTSPAGASFTLDGRGSSDPDDDLTLVSWRQGTRTGPEVSNGRTVVQALGVGVTRNYVLRVIDSHAQSDEDTTQVAVVDTTPPTLTLSVSPTTLKPPNHKLVTITATLTTSDVCDATPTIKLLSIVSNEPDNGLGDGDQPQDVQGAAFGTDDRTFQLRSERSGKGNGRIYTITYEARDDSGNATVRQATVTVPH